MPRVNSIPTKVTKIVLISVLLLTIMSLPSDQREIRQNRNPKIERRRQPRQVSGTGKPVSCKPPLVVNFNGDACLLPLNSPCKNHKECPLNSECVKSKCICFEKAVPHEDNLSCEFFYTEDLSVNGDNTRTDKSSSSRPAPGILRWNSVSVKMWTMAFGIIVAQ